MTATGLVRGDRVLLRPGARADVFDLALAGRTAVVSSIERDLEGRAYVAVIVDDDPGVSIGPRRPGHRFFFSPEEVERLGPGDPGAAAPGSQTVLVAGIGNLFLGDDAFGVEVIQRLVGRPLPENVRAADYGIRGFDLAYALAEDPAHVILVDACPRGEPPGTVSVVEPDLAALDQADAEPGIMDAHTMNPLTVLRLARSLGAPLRHVLLVGCEPATLGPEEGHVGLSAPVEAAIERAVTVIESLLARLRPADEPSHPTSPSA